MPNFSGGPTWDLLLGVCLLLVILYGFIIGQSKTTKTLLMLYPSFFMADLLGTWIPSIIPIGFSGYKLAIINGSSTKTIDLLPDIDMDSLKIILGLKIFLFFSFWLITTIKSPFNIDISENKKTLGNAFLHFIISLTFGILFVNIVLLLLSGYSIFSHNIPLHILEPYMKDSFLINVFIKFYGSWFAFPAFIFLFSGFLHAPADDPNGSIEENEDNNENKEE